MKGNLKKRDKEMNDRIHITLSENVMNKLRFLSQREDLAETVVWDFQHYIQYVYGGFPTNIRYNPYSRCIECDVVCFKDC